MQEDYSGNKSKEGDEHLYNADIELNEHQNISEAKVIDFNQKVQELKTPAKKFFGDNQNKPSHYLKKSNVVNNSPVKDRSADISFAPVD